MSVLRILCLLRGLVPPPADVRRDVYWHLSRALEGDVLLPVWWASEETARQKLGPEAYPVYTVGRFRYRFLLAGRFRGIRQKAEIFRFFLWVGRRLYREWGYDCIVVYGHQMTALAGAILKRLTGAKLIVEIVTDPSRVNLLYERPGAFSRLAGTVAQLSSDVSLHLAVLASDRVILRYPTQLARYRRLRHVPSSVVHGFVPTTMIASQPEPAERYVLLIGYPWYVKGADLLIRAFRQIAGEFPEVKLKLLGHDYDCPALKILAANSPQIEFLRARPHPEAMNILAGAEVLAIPSRTEGFPRVLTEGMSARKAIVASDAGGIPHYLEHGRNGLLFRSGNVEELAERLRTLLSDAALRRRLAENAYEFARAKLSEEAYVEAFRQAVAATVSPQGET